MSKIELTQEEKDRYQIGLFLQKCRASLLVRGIINRNESSKINQKIKKEYGSDKKSIKRKAN